ncbi:MAG: ribonuclease PH [Bradymonadales bacterium]|nr:MAG: ribonuclease PH [Bradymonadales bacterium]
MPRIDGRSANDLRPIRFIPGVQRDPLGSVLVEWGDTKVICSASVDEKLPPWMQGQNRGWITAEYSMLPGSSDRRIQRERARNSGRTQEIQRLIGRSLRACIQLENLGPRTIIFDCDVLQADGGTRVASITGSYLALRLALAKLVELNRLKTLPPTNMLAAISVGKLSGECLCDLNYHEDARAEVDANVVMNDRGEFIEMQATAEDGAFRLEEWNQLLESAQAACRQIFQIQKKTLEDWKLE